MTHVFKNYVANQNPRVPDDTLDTLIEPIWADDDNIEMVFGQKMNNFGQRVYEIYLE